MAFSTVLGLSSCNPKPEEIALPFETIEQKEWAGTEKPYESREPNLMIVSRLEEVDNLSGLITDEAKTQLQTVDYSNYFALLVLQGWKPNTGYKVTITHIARIENDVNIYAEFIEPEPDTAVSPAVTSPYHLVKVQKVGNWGQKVTFNLVSSNKPVISFTHKVP